MLTIGCLNYPSKSNLKDLERLSENTYNLILSKDSKNKIESLLGRKLLVKIIKNMGLEDIIMDNITYNKYGKPLIENANFHFNISHSHQKVVAIVSTENEVGIDIEKIRPISLNGFEYFFTKKEWKQISSAENPSENLLNCWTIKEAALKCIGTGFNNIEQEVIINNNDVSIIRDGYESRCYYKTIYLDDYILTYASLGEITNPISINYYTTNDL